MASTTRATIKTTWGRWCDVAKLKKVLRWIEESELSHEHYNEIKKAAERKLNV